jgi:ferredoxin
MSALVTKITENRHEGTNPKRRYQIEILRDVCIGAASCVAIAPETFGLDDENKVVIVESDWDEEDIILAAAQSCPVFAIIVKDAETGQQIFPVE